MPHKKLSQEELDQKIKEKKERQAKATNQYRSRFKSATYLTDRDWHAYCKLLAQLNGISSMQQLYNMAMQEFILRLELSDPHLKEEAERTVYGEQSSADSAGHANGVVPSEAEINLDGCALSFKQYGGTSCRKVGIRYKDDLDYMLKYPSLFHPLIPVYEHLGSRIYHILGIPVQQTFLGIRNGQYVVACRDFTAPGDTLYTFDRIKMTCVPGFPDSDGQETDGKGTDLQETLMTLRRHPIFFDSSDAEDRFWKMFVVDALIGNTDRSNDNWGILVPLGGYPKLAPVFDNGSCLNWDWDIDRMADALDNEYLFADAAYYKGTCAFTLHKKPVNPYQLIHSMEYEMCSRAVLALTPLIGEKLPVFQKLIEQQPLLQPVQKDFYIRLLAARYERVFYPVYRALRESGM